MPIILTLKIGSFEIELTLGVKRAAVVQQLPAPTTRITNAELDAWAESVHAKKNGKKSQP